MIDGFLLIRCIHGSTPFVAVPSVAGMLLSDVTVHKDYATVVGAEHIPVSEQVEFSGTLADAPPESQHERSNNQALLARVDHLIRHGTEAQRAAVMDVLPPEPLPTPATPKWSTAGHGSESSIDAGGIDDD